MLRLVYRTGRPPKTRPDSPTNNLLPGDDGNTGALPAGSAQSQGTLNCPPSSGTIERHSAMTAQQLLGAWLRCSLDRCIYGLYSCGLYSYGLYSYSLYSYSLYSYGLYSYGLYSHGFDVVWIPDTYTLTIA